MKGAVGAAMHLEFTSRKVALDPLKERVSIQWWFEWMRDGQRVQSPKRSELRRQGIVSATGSLVMGREKYGIRHGAEVIIPSRPRKGQPCGVRVSRLYIDGRPIVGAELKGLLARFAARASRRGVASKLRVEKLDADLARIR